MVLGVTGFQKVLVIRPTTSRACSTLALVSSTVTRRDWKSGSKTTLMPPSFPMLSKIRLAAGHQQLEGAAQLLVGDEAGGVDGQSFFKLGGGRLEQALVAQLVAAVDVHLGGLERQPLGPQLVVGVRRVGLQRPLVVDERGVVVLGELGLLAF